MSRMTLASGLGVLMLMIVASLACNSASPAPPQGRMTFVDGGSYRSIGPGQLNAMLDDKDFLLVNVHIPYEGEIRETDLFAPYDEMEQSLSGFPDSKEAKIVLYCRSDPMSDTAARTLVNLGFTSVYTLEGGFAEWQNQGFQLIVVPPSTAQPKVHFDDDFVDLGMVPHGEVVDYTFDFKNVGDAPLIIEDVSAKALEGC